MGRSQEKYLPRIFADERGYELELRSPVTSSSILIRVNQRLSAADLSEL
jgi:hypothetical protein